VLTTAGSGATSYGFTGEWTDANNLQYLRARYYAPTQGRFLTADTWAGNYRQPLTLNKWLYTNGNPVNFTDPSGHFLDTPLDALFVTYDMTALAIDVALWAVGPESQRSHWAGQAGIDAGALVIDLLFAAILGATGGGMAFRGAMALVGAGRTAVMACGVSLDVIRAAQLGLKGVQAVGRFGPLTHFMSDEGPTGGGGGLHGNDIGGNGQVSRPGYSGPSRGWPNQKPHDLKPGYNVEKLEAMLAHEGYKPPSPLVQYQGTFSDRAKYGKTGC